MNKNAQGFSLAVLAWSAFLLAWAAGADAQGRYARLSDRGYQEIRRLAHELDEVAAHAGDQAQHSQAWVYRNDRNFVRSVNRFADRVQSFHERMDSYQARPWQVDDELRSLIRDARNVQYRAEHARSIDRHTVADWNRVTEILNQMIRVYQADVARRSWEPWDGYGPRYGAPAPAPRPYPPAYQRGGADRGQLGSLTRDLVQRTDRIYNYATSAAGPFVTAEPRERAALDAVLHVREQAQAFEERLASSLDGSRLAASAEHLAQDAREADARVRQARYFLQIQGEWQEAMRLVGEIQAIAAGS